MTSLSSSDFLIRGPGAGKIRMRSFPRGGFDRALTCSYAYDGRDSATRLVPPYACFPADLTSPHQVEQMSGVAAIRAKRRTALSSLTIIFRCPP